MNQHYDSQAACVCFFFSNTRSATSNVKNLKDIMLSSIDMTQVLRCQSETSFGNTFFRTAHHANLKQACLMMAHVLIGHAIRNTCVYILHEVFGMQFTWKIFYWTFKSNTGPMLMLLRFAHY